MEQVNESVFVEETRGTIGVGDPNKLDDSEEISRPSEVGQTVNESMKGPLGQITNGSFLYKENLLEADDEGPMTELLKDRHFNSPVLHGNPNSSGLISVNQDLSKQNTTSSVQAIKGGFKSKI